jgi:hypothetical protein
VGATSTASVADVCLLDHAQNKEKDNLVLSLAELFSHVPYGVIRLALHKSGRNADAAASLLSSDKELDALFAEAETGSARAVVDGAVGVVSRAELESLATYNFLVRVLSFIEHAIVTCGIFCVSTSVPRLCLRVGVGVGLG